MWWRAKRMSSLICFNCFSLIHVCGVFYLVRRLQYHVGQENLNMMRISIVQSSSQAVTLRVEGEVKGRWVAELGRACEEALSRDIRLDLDLADVAFVDIDGINLFRVLMDRQVVFTNPCPFIAEQLGVSK
jgi:hypothetical protein